MAAKRSRSALVCLFVGHNWEWRDVPEGQPYRCTECGHYDDEPWIVRVSKLRATFNRWSPLTIKATRKEARARVGTPYHRHVPQLSLSVELHYGWDRYTGGPGITVTLHAWCLRAGARVGGFWQDEDGEGRSLGGLWAHFSTYGLRYVGCWLGHRPGDRYGTGYVSCDRCDETLEAPSGNQSEAKVAA